MNDLQIGDVVTIRMWDDMAVEFGDEDSFDISGPPECYAFISCMKGYCGGNFTIESIGDPDDTLSISERFYELRDENGDHIPYYFHEWMFEDSVEEKESMKQEPEYQIDFLFN